MVTDEIRKVIQGALAEEVEFTVERPRQAEHGDYATNAALTAAKQLDTDPRALAERLQAELQVEPMFATVGVAGPGFLNFRLADRVFVEELAQVLEAGENYGQSDVANGQTVVVEYSQPNIAKRFSMGHLRSTIIGQALCNIYRATGWRVIATNHLGDWGTQFGKMIVSLRKWAERPVTELGIEDLEALYIRFHQEAESSPELEDEARNVFKKLEDGDPEVRAIWNNLVAISMQEFDRLYKRLGTTIEFAYGESTYEDLLPGVMEDAQRTGLAEESEGAVIVRFPEDEIPPAILRKSDGASTYFARDLAAIKFRHSEWKPDRFVYEVAVDQSLHFKQVFWAAELLGWGQREDYVHVAHGLVRLPEGKMSTRKGRTVKLEPVLDEAVQRAAKINKDVAEEVGIGAVKYHDLKRSPSTGYVFDLDEMVTLEGNSGPYIQYVYARCQAILRKAGDPGTFTERPVTPTERAVLLHIAEYPRVVRSASLTHAPNAVATYLFELTQHFNRFYETDSVLRAEANVRKFRLALTRSTACVIHNGLALLGIATPEEM